MNYMKIQAWEIESSKQGKKMSVHDFAEMYIIVPRTNCGILIQMDSHFTN